MSGSNPVTPRTRPRRRTISAAPPGTLGAIVAAASSRQGAHCPVADDAGAPGAGRAYSKRRTQVPSL